MIGQTFGQLTVINNPNITKGGKRYWECECSCGRVILVPTGNLKSGNSSQCRACGNKNRKTKPRKHGETKTRLYRIWTSMKSRCSNPVTINFHRYGGRGIKVCDEWEKSYESFRDWALSSGYSDNLSLDRVDNDGDYEPDNCRWATRKEQSENMYTAQLITFNGETHCLAGWARKLGFSKSTLTARINRYGWPIERALTETPTRGGNVRERR
jgi:hypothetical protein